MSRAAEESSFNGTLWSVLGGVLLGVVLPYVILFTVLFFWRRDKQPIRSRGPLFQTIANVFVIFFWLWIAIRMFTYLDYPCLLNQWFIFSLLPVYALSYIFRCIHLYFRYSFTQSILAVEDQPDEKQRGQCMENSFFMKYRKFSKQRTLLKYYFIVMGVLSLVFVVYSIVAEGYSMDWGRDDSIHCDSRAFLIVLGVAGLMFIAIIAVQAWLMRGVKEAFSIKTEFKFVLSFWVVVLLAYFIIIIWVPDNPVMILFNGVPLLFAFTMSSTVQVYLTYRQPGSEVNMSDVDLESADLRDLLEDKGGYIMFRDFLTMELCVENLLVRMVIRLSSFVCQFYGEVSEFEVSKKEGAELLEEAERIKEKYLEPGSQYEINIDYALVNDIVDEIKSKSVTNNTFLEAKQWIYELMRTDSYPRFRKAQKAKK